MNIEKDMTQSERMAVIREHAQKFTKKLKRNQRVRKTETKSLDKSVEMFYNQENINHWTDASKYAEEHYGDVYRQTTRYDNEWD
jgi:hypothetical protein|tara:strand:+ start:409 stop:660 length:252 start_codon:yes stop_codon:yes gene_type:complete